MTLQDIQGGRRGVGASLARAGLEVLSWGWAAGLGLGAAARRLGLARPRALPVPVVSVGNLAVGGTGKTPFVAWLAGRLGAAGHHPGILARGYGPRAPGALGLDDEGAVLRHVLGPNVPQVQDPDRLRAGRVLLDAHPEVDVLLLDDGFQHRHLKRDLDVVLLDATRPFGYGHLLPRGLLRERPAALRRAGAVVLARSERLDAERLETLRGRVHDLTPAPVAVARTEVVGPAAGLDGVPVLACCGIGNPQAFVGTLEDLGARVVARRFLPDHGTLPADGWPGILARARAAGAERVAITRKDAVKHENLPAEVVVVDVRTVVGEGAEDLWAAVRRVVER